MTTIISDVVLSSNSSGFMGYSSSTTQFIPRTFTGTSNQVIVSNGDGVSLNTTFSLPQDIHSGASPTFSQITLASDPSSDLQVATKQYVDAVAQGLAVKDSAIVATTAVLSTYVYNNGSSGVGATITMVATGVIAIDGRNLALGDIVLVKDETSTNKPYNGLYDVTTAGAVGVALILTRNVTFNQASEIEGGFIFVESGTTNASAGFVCTNTGTPTMGTTDIAFQQFSGAGQITAGTGLSKSGNVLSVSTNGITNALLRQSAALSIIGNSTNATADVADIAAGTDGYVLRRSGTALGFGQLAIGAFADNIITAAKLSASATNVLFGRSTASAGAGEEIACTAAGRAILDDADAAAQRATLSAAQLGANSDITSLSGLTTALSIGQGGTGQTTAQAAREAFFIGTVEKIETKTAAYTLVAGDSGKIFENTGAAAEVIITLPASPTVGFNATISCLDADLIRFQAQGTHTIRSGSVVSAAAGYAQCMQIGAKISLLYIASAQWIITSAVGQINIT